MFNLVPEPIQILDHTEDSKNTRHYRFRLMASEELSNWQLAQPGQFFMLNVPGVGEAPFSFTEPPNANGEFRALIRQMGTVTSALFNMPAGDILGVRGPFGIGWPVEKIRGNNLLIVAGGCGLAPLVSLINDLASHSKQQLTLLYGAKNRETQMLTSEREHWQKSMTVINTIESDEKSSGELAGSKSQSSELTKGKVTGSENSSGEYIGTPLDLLPQAVASLDESPAAVLVCGPERMMHAVAQFFTDHGLSSDAIFLSIERRMHCAVGLCGHCYIKDQYVCKNGPTFSWQDLQQLGLGS